MTLITGYCGARGYIGSRDDWFETTDSRCGQSYPLRGIGGGRMRALFTCQPTLGHFLPLTPIASALAEAGHDVAFGAPAAFRTTVEAHAFRWVPCGAGNTDRCAELGVSRSLDPEELEPGSIRDVLLDVLRTPSYRQNAERLRAEFERLPRVDTVVELLDRLARNRAPIIAPR